MGDTYRLKKFEENFSNSCKIIQRELKSLELSNGNMNSVIVSSVEIESELMEAESYMKAIDVESRLLLSSSGSNDRRGIWQHKEEYSNLMNQYQTARSNAESQVLKANTKNTNNNSTNNKLKQSTAMLEESRRILADTEDTGGIILNDMESQREIIVDAQRNVQETRGFTTNAKRVLRNMGNRAVMHQICVFVTILILLGVIIGLGYYKWGKKS
jgi:hypothetical protein